MLCTTMKKDLTPRKVLKEKVQEAHVPRTTLSFYRYVRLNDPQTMRDALFARMSELGCLVRIYVTA